MLGLFRRPREEERRQADALKPLIRGILDLGEDVALSVSEIQCGDARCPGLETVILVMQPGERTAAYKVAAPLAESTRRRSRGAESRVRSAAADPLRSGGPARRDRLDLDHEFRAREAGDDHQRRGRRRRREAPVAHLHIGRQMLAAVT